MTDIWTNDRPSDPIWWEVRGKKVVAAFCTIGDCIAEAAPIIRKLLKLGNDGGKSGSKLGRDQVGRQHQEPRRGNQVHGAWRKDAFPKIERAFGTITRMAESEAEPEV